MPIWVPLAKAMIRAGVAQRLPSIRRLLGDGTPFLKYYSRRILGSPNVELKATQEMLADMPKDVIDLSLGAPAIDETMLSLPALQAEEASGYPPVAGLPALRSVVAHKLERDNQIAVDPDHQVLVSNGVSQGIGVMLDTFVDWGERVVILDPSFFIYRLAALNRGAKVTQVPTWLDAGRTRFEESVLQKSLRGAKVLFLNSPSNPTGGVLAAEDLERIAYWCHRHDVLIFSDEVYERFQYEGTHQSIGALDRARERTITANGLSKSHGLAAMRIGFLAGSRYLIQPMIVSKLSTSPFVSVAAQRMAVAALEQPPAAFGPVRARYQARRDAVARALFAAGLPHERPAGAFYFWVPVRLFGMTGAEFTRRFLAEEHVKVMAGEPYGKSGHEFIRISYAGDGRRLAAGLAKLKVFAARISPYGSSLVAGQTGAGAPTPSGSKRFAVGFNPQESFR